MVLQLLTTEGELVRPKCRLFHQVAVAFLKIVHTDVLFLCLIFALSDSKVFLLHKYILSIRILNGAIRLFLALDFHGGYEIPPDLWLHVENAGTASIAHIL